MDFDLMCNVKKCRKRLSNGHAWATLCSHVFCNKCAEEHLLKSKICPACRHALPEKMDFVRMELNPTDKFKSMVLLGLRPDIVMDICARAISFWTYQNHQEHLYKEHAMGKSKDRMAEMEKYFNQLTANWKMEAKSLKDENTKEKEKCATIKKRCSELSDQLREKTKEYQRLQSSYNSLKRTSTRLIKQELGNSSNDTTQYGNFPMNDTLNGNASFSAFDVPSSFVGASNEKPLFSSPDKSKTIGTVTSTNMFNFSEGGIQKDGEKASFNCATDNLHSDFHM